ncbi:HEAT repeat domain-containing protein [Streptomyces sp. 1331.2]|uniref:HEAT repeat domain-containing protein n=1 Tax=Streptomyces sp. 1331.2 TaxID=1938835 RepID=UPI000BC55233|nr:HEAT repeat domain-containing protein [Streptomyces sp. 1331.2]SOB78925.1 HEAT repeat-containing protein [Streptomyces sp. 1331.2]
MARHRHPDPAHRRFVASHLSIADVPWQDGYPCYLDEEAGLLAAWALVEPDGEVPAEVLVGLGSREHPAGEAIGLRHADHPDPRVRREVPRCLGADHGDRLSAAATACVRRPALDPDEKVRAGVGWALQGCPVTSGTRAALLTLVRDEAPAVRLAAGSALAASADRTREVADALAALLDEDEQRLRLEGTYGLLLRDDPRTAAGVERLGPLAWPEYRYDHRAEPVRQWRRRRDRRGEREEHEGA